MWLEGRAHLTELILWIVQEKIQAAPSTSISKCMWLHPPGPIHLPYTPMLLPLTIAVDFTDLLPEFTITMAPSLTL